MGRKKYLLLLAVIMILSFACDKGWDFAPLSYQVSGYVRDKAGEGVSACKIIFTGDVTGSTVTGKDGHWKAVLEGNVIITPIKDKFTFTPLYLEVKGEAHDLDFILEGNLFTLTIEVEGEGLVQVSPKEDLYEAGTEVLLTAEPLPDVFFGGWQGDIISLENPISLVMDADKTIRAFFSNRETDLKFHEICLSSGTGSLLLEKYGSSDAAFIILYSMDDLGGTHVVQRLSLEQEGAVVEPYTPIPITPPLEQPLLADGSFLRKGEQEILRNHLWARGEPPFLEDQPQLELGTEKEFLVYRERHYQETITATLMHEGENYLLWVDSTQSISTSLFQEIGSIYEKTIRPMVMEVGQEPTSKTFSVLEKTGEKLHILLVPLPYSSGYFNPYDLYSREVYQESNQRKIIYLNLMVDDREGLKRMMGTLAHQLQAMVFLHEKILANRFQDEDDLFIDDTWIREGFSYLFQQVVGFPLGEEAFQFLMDHFIIDPHHTSPMDWRDDYSHQAMAYLFAQYLYDRFGEEILSAIYTSPLKVKGVLREVTGQDFSGLFLDWAITLLFHQLEGVPKHYTFKHVNLNLQPLSLHPGSFWSQQSIKGFGIHYNAVGPGNGNDLQIHVEGVPKEGHFRMIVVEKRGD